MWQATQTRPAISVSHRGTAVDLIQYMAASGKVAPGLTHVLSSWKQNNKGRQRDQQGDSWPVYHFSSSKKKKSTQEMSFTAHTKDVVI